MPRPNQRRGELLDIVPANQTCREGTGDGNADNTSEILKELKLFRTETAENFGVLRKEVSDIKLNFEELKTRVNDAEQRIADNEDRNMDLTKVLFHLMCKQKCLEEKCEGLEGRSRRNNLRIYSVPEKTEGSNMIEFIEKLIREQLNIREEIYIERAHRAVATGVSTGRAADFTRSIIVYFRSFKEKQRVLYAAWSLKDIRIKDQRILMRIIPPTFLRSVQNTGVQGNNSRRGKSSLAFSTPQNSCCFCRMERQQFLKTLEKQLKD